MATIDRVHELEAANKLRHWSSPLQPVASVVRKFWVTEEVAKSLEADPWPAILELASQANDRRIRTHTMVNQFVEGQSLSVGTKLENADLKCLAPLMRVPDFRVWELRPWQTLRLTRVLGEFAAPDQFVALAVVPRIVIWDWDKLMGIVDAKWLNLFPGNSPLHWNRVPKAADIGVNFWDV